MSNIWISAADGDFNAIKNIIEEEGMSPDAEDDVGYTPLQAGASWNHKHIVEYLLEKGADINKADNDGDTPLHYCEDEKMCSFLIENGANPLLRNNSGYLPIEKAYLEGLDGVVEFLKPYSPPNLNLTALGENESSANAEVIEWLMNGGDSNEVIDESNTYHSDNDDCIR